MSTSLYQNINATGVILTDTSAILAQVESEWKAVFGADLVVTSDTPQGVMIAAEAQARAAVANNNAAVANQINPNQSGGVFLDALMSWMGIQRVAASFTQVSGVVLTGVPGTIIPLGVQATTAAGDIFLSQSAVTIPASGTITVNFAAQKSGAVPCAAHTLTNISASTAVIGWETITNPNVGVLGVTQMSDALARTFRNTTLANQGVNSALAIKSGLAQVAGVTSFAFLENTYPVPQGMIVGITGGSTLSGKTFCLTTAGVGTPGTITVDSTSLAYSQTGQLAPIAAVNPWPTAAFATVANIALSGLGTQSGGDWAAPLTDGQIVLAVLQSAPSQNGLWVAHSGAWTRHSYMTSGASLLGSNNGISMIRNSIWACVQGGTDLAVGTVLLEEKSEGCGWNGSTSVSVLEPSSLQTYGVLFDRPTLVQIAVIVTLSQGTNTSNLQQTALQAIIDFTTGQISGEAGWIIGAAASPFDLAAAIVSEQPGVKVRDVQIASAPGLVYQTTEIAIAKNQQAVLYMAYITINVVP